MLRGRVTKLPHSPQNVHILVFCVPKNCYKFNDLKWQKDQKAGTGLSGLKSRGWQGLGPFLETLGENLHLCLFQLLEATCIPWLMTLFLCLQSQQLDILLTFLHLPCLSLTEGRKLGKPAYKLGKIPCF